MPCSLVFALATDQPEGCAGHAAMDAAHDGAATTEGTDRGGECHVGPRGEGGVVSGADGVDAVREAPAQLPHALLERGGRCAPAIHLHSDRLQLTGLPISTQSGNSSQDALQCYAGSAGSRGHLATTGGAPQAEAAYRQVHRCCRETGLGRCICNNPHVDSYIIQCVVSCKHATGQPRAAL